MTEQEEENVVTIPPQLTEKVTNRGGPLEDATAVEDAVESVDVSREDVQVEEVEQLKQPEPRRSARIAGGKVRTGPVTAFHTSVRKGIQEHSPRAGSKTRSQREASKKYYSFIDVHEDEVRWPRQI